MKKMTHILNIWLMFFFLPALGTAAGVSEAESNKAHILMLEKALTPQNIDAVAHLFAKANKERNGAVQFMLFSDELKNKYKNQWPYWVSGVSSPWITSYTIKKSAGSKMSVKFNITYQWATASGPFYPPLRQTIVVTPVPKNNTSSSQKFWISEFIEH